MLDSSFLSSDIKDTWPRAPPGRYSRFARLIPIDALFEEKIGGETVATLVNGRFTFDLLVLLH